MEEIDFLLKEVLIVVIIFAVGGVSWQLIKLLGKTTQALEEFRRTNENLNSLVDKASNDYEYISSTVRSLSVTIDRLNQEVLDPIRNVSKVFQVTQGITRGIFNRFSRSDDPESYLPVKE